MNCIKTMVRINKKIIVLDIIPKSKPKFEFMCSPSLGNYNSEKGNEKKKRYKTTSKVDLSSDHTPNKALPDEFIRLSEFFSKTRG